MSLSNTAFRKLNPQVKPFKLADSAGLYLLVKPKSGISSIAMAVKRINWPLVPTPPFL